MRVSTLLPAAATLLAFSGVASANLHSHTGVSAHHQDKRTLGLLCGILGGILGGSCGSSGSKYPSSSWQCSGNGQDGWDYDYNGSGRPSWAPSGWKWFGSNKGWHPSKGWGVPSNNWSPPSQWSCSKATWWAPSSQWQYPGTFLGLIPDFWLGLGWHSYKGPSVGWQTGGGGNDGWDFDYKGNSCPYGNVGFKFFGDNFGWGPSKGWQVPSNSYSFPGDCLNRLSLFKWWSPSLSWNRPSNYNCPSWWPSTGGNNGGDDDNHGDDGGNDNGYPDSNWQCDGSGNDGKDHDHNGASCPYGNGFKWFGSNHGWQPAKDWKCPSDTWSPPSGWSNTCSKATWWKPQNSWHYPGDFPIPSFWVGLGWSGYNWAPSSFQCNGKGNDGWSFDHLGHGLPSGYPSGWLYFGIDRQWCPPQGWGLPSKTFKFPGGWNPKYSTWWSPNIKWSVPQGFACPKWWSVSLLNPLGGLLSWIL